MPKAGRYDYPSRPLDALIDRVKKIYEVLGPVAKRQHVAETLGMSYRSGSFGSLIGSMEIFGLIETGGGDIRITELGKAVAFETDDRLLQEAKAKAVGNVELFSDLFRQYGSDINEEKVKAFLRAKASVDVAELPRHADEIGKLLKRVSPYLSIAPNGAEARSDLQSVAQTVPETPASRGAGGDIARMTPVEDGLIEFRFGATYFRLPASDISTAKLLIDNILNAKMKPNVSEPKKDEPKQ